MAFFHPPMRAIFLSQAYADPAARGKLQALTGLGCAVAAGIPATGSAVRAMPHGDDAGVLIAPIPARNGPAGVRWSRAALRRLLTEFRPDLIQLEEPAVSAGTAEAARLARRLRIPVVLFTARSLPDPLTLRQRLRRRTLLRTAAGVLAENRLAADLVAGARPGLPVEPIPQLGIAVPPLRAIPANQEFTIGFFGRLLPERGVDLLFRACVRLLGSWRIELVGTGPAQEELEGLAARLGIAARITWHGALPRPAVSEVWSRVDCAVLPSRRTPRWVETVGRAALEAMGREIPVVATQSGSLPELIDQAGLLVPEDDVPQLGAALQQLLDSPELRRSLGSEGRRRVLARFSDEAVARRTLAFWQSILPGFP